MDLCSVNPALLDSLDAEIDRRVARAAEVHGVEWEKEEVTRNEAGGTEEMLADRFHHPVERGIPAISVGRSHGGDQHTLSDWADAPSALNAMKMVLLLALSLAGVDG